MTFGRVSAGGGLLADKINIPYFGVISVKIGHLKHKNSTLIFFPSPPPPTQTFLAETPFGILMAFKKI